MFLVVFRLEKKKLPQWLPSSVRGLRSRKNIIGKTMQNLSGWPPDLVTILVIKKRIDNEQFICNINSCDIFIFINIM